MKKAIILLTLVSFVSLVSNAQLRFGVAPGMSMARIAIAGATGGPLKYKPGLDGGLFLEARLSDNFTIQPEANYSMQGTSVIASDGSTAGSYQFDYLTIPVLVKMYATKQLNFFAGPQIGILLSAKTKSSTSADVNVKSQLKSTNMYAVFGAEYCFANGVFISSRYNLGMQNIAKTGTTELKNKYLSFRIGYSCPLGGSTKK